MPPRSGTSTLRFALLDLWFRWPGEGTASERPLQNVAFWLTCQCDSESTQMRGFRDVCSETLRKPDSGFRDEQCGQCSKVTNAPHLPVQGPPERAPFGNWAGLPVGELTELDGKGT